MNTAVATIGHNSPPEPTPYEKALAEIDGLYSEAGNWLDGAKVENQATADGLAKLLTMIRDAKKRADESRKTENEPFDTGKAEVQARYNPVLKKADLATDVCRRALAPWLDKIDREQREAAEKARREADKKAREAKQAFRQSQSTDLAERERAEALLEESKQAERIARHAEKATPTAHGGGAKAISLRTTYKPVLKNSLDAARHYWKANRVSMEEFLTRLAEQDVRNGKRTIPGFEVVEEKTAV